ncbi:MAG: ATP-binding cassette domain-containing protein [Oscillospiraceae bacterium]
MVNDDKPLIHISENQVTVYGTLHNGKHRLGANISIAYVPQGNQLMSGTIRKIVTFADISALHDEEIWKALKISCVKDFVNDLENGIDTLLGERGTELSEGHMQRIAVARAVFSESPVLFLDEVTSSLDERIETELLKNLKNITHKTVLIITHRPAALKICDKIFEIQKGKITIKSSVYSDA